jgi:hypothetical protein
MKLGRRVDAGRQATGPARAGHRTTGRCERGAGPGPVVAAVVLIGSGAAAAVAWDLVWIVGTVAVSGALVIAAAVWLTR